jgi:nascent polypeptide-associated complex subunit alpha
MFPGGMDPRQMASMMRQFGIKNEEIKTKRVVIETVTGKKIIIEPASVLQIDMKGDKSFQVSGTIKEGGSSAENEQEAIESSPEEEEGKISETDIGIVSEQAKVSREVAAKALEESNGDIAEAIMKLEKG